MNKLGFRSHFHVEIVDNEGVFLLSERDQFRLRGNLYEWLAPFLDGTRTEQEIIECLRNRALAPAVRYALAELRRKGYVEEIDDDLPIDSTAFWNSLGFERKQAVSKLRASTVAIFTFGRIHANELAAVLQSLGIRTCKDGDIFIALTDDYLQEGLQAFNGEALQSQRPWLLCKPVGTEVWLGPLFDPRKTGCWECLAQRLRNHRQLAGFIQEKKRRPGAISVSKGTLPAIQQLTERLIAIEIARWIIGGENANLQGRVITLGLDQMSMESHQLVKRSQCPACGQATEHREIVPVVLESRKKGFVAEGAHRVVPPETTFQLFQHHASPITGAVSNISRVGTPNHFLHIYASGQDVALIHQGEHLLRDTRRNRSNGKGITDAQAKASVLCEGIERYSGTFHGNEPRIRATCRELRESAIHPNACMNFSENQYRNRGKWKLSTHPHCSVPQPFDHEKSIDWTPVWSLTHETLRYLPTSYCYYGYPDDTFCRADSNGNAAGNTLEETILQGFMELVERDSVAIWWYNRIQRPGVDLLSFHEPYFPELLKYYESLKREVWALDLTADLNIPAFAAISRSVAGRTESILFGFGAHFDARLALLRALTEMAQIAPHLVMNGSEADAKRMKNVLHREWLLNATLKGHPYLSPDQNSRLRAASDFSNRSNEDLRDDVLTCVDLAHQKGMETLVLDQTQADIGLPVAKVIVPGMRHFWPRFGSGRLYDVPVQLGWLKEPLTESALNPVPIFL